MRRVKGHTRKTGGHVAVVKSHNRKGDGRKVRVEKHETQPSEENWRRKVAIQHEIEQQD